MRDKGYAAYLAGEFDRSQQLYSQALEMAKRDPADPLSLARSYVDCAEVCYAKRAFSQSADLYRLAISLYQQILTRPNSRHSVLSGLELELSHATSALAHIRQVIDPAQVVQESTAGSSKTEARSGLFATSEKAQTKPAVVTQTATGRTYTAWLKNYMAAKNALKYRNLTAALRFAHRSLQVARAGSTKPGENSLNAVLQVLDSLELLAKISNIGGNVEQEKAYLTQALSLREKYLWPDHSDLIENRLALAKLYAGSNNWTKAESLYSSLSNTTNCDLAFLSKPIADAMAAMKSGDLSESTCSTLAFAHTMALKQRTIPELLMTSCYLATYYIANGQPANAKKLLESDLQLSYSNPGRDSGWNDNTLAVLAGISNESYSSAGYKPAPKPQFVLDVTSILIKKKKEKESEKISLYALDAWKEHPTQAREKPVIYVLVHVSNIEAQKSNPKLSAHYAKKALDLLRELHLEHCDLTASLLTDLSACQLWMPEERGQVVSNSQKALQLVIDLHGPTSFEAATRMICLAKSYELTLASETAAKTYSSALNLFQTHHSHDRSAIADCWIGLGRCYWSMKKRSESKRCIAKGLAVFKECNDFKTAGLALQSYIYILTLQARYNDLDEIAKQFFQLFDSSSERQKLLDALIGWGDIEESRASFRSAAYFYQLALQLFHNTDQASSESFHRGQKMLKTCQARLQQSRNH